MTHLRLDPDPLTVPEQPVRACCPRCGRLTSTPGPCFDCQGRGGNAIGFMLAVAVVVIAVLLIVAAASRSGSDPRPATGLIGPGLSGAPGYDSPGGSARPAPGASTGEDTPTTIGMRPASDGAAAAASPPAATPAPASHVGSREGFISHVGPGFPDDYLALPCKHGSIRCDLTVRLCGPSDCIVLEQTDYGPSQQQHPDRIADVSPAVFVRLCGVPSSFGLCNGSWTVVVDPAPTLPATDTEGEGA